MTLDIEPIQRKLDYDDHCYIQKVRLQRKCSEGKIDFAKALQRIWQNAIFKNGNMDEVYEMIRSNITWQAVL
jgi:hypothetical protein